MSAHGMATERSFGILPQALKSFYKNCLALFSIFFFFSFSAISHLSTGVPCNICSTPVILASVKPPLEILQDRFCLQWLCTVKVSITRCCFSSLSPSLVQFIV